MRMHAHIRVSALTPTTRRVALGLFLAVLLASLAGCATSEADSELPWSTRESWEGTVPLPPGMFEN